jgi:hypothetical protein
MKNIISKDVVFKAEFCGIKLSTVDWNEPKYLQVYGFSDGIYNQQDRSMMKKLQLIKFQRPGKVSKLFL